MNKRTESAGSFRQMIAAAALVLVSCLALSACGSTKTSGTDGSRTVECMAECNVEEPGISYVVYLEMEVDDSGQIVSVKDAGTQVPEGKDSLYKKAQALFEELKGKTADTLSEVDAVSGATCSSKAILAAAEQGLE